MEISRLLALWVTNFGIFKGGREGNVTTVISPGDPMPGNHFFDSGENSGPSINQGGDVAFTAHLAGEIAGRSSIYVKEGGTGKINPIAHGGDPAPRGGVFRGAFSPVLNDSGTSLLKATSRRGTPVPCFRNWEFTCIQRLGGLLLSRGPGIRCRAVDTL